MESVEDLQLAIQENMPEENITVQDLKRLTSETVLKYCIRFLVDMGVDMDKLLNEPVEGNEAPNDVDVKIRIVMAIKQIYPLDGGVMSDFGFDTLDHPKPNDLQYIANLNSFHHYAMSRSETTLGSHIQELDALQAKADSLKQQHAELLMKANTAAVVRANRPTEAEKVQKQMSLVSVHLIEDRDSLRKAQKQHTELQQQVALLQSAFDAETAAVDELDTKLEVLDLGAETRAKLQALQTQRAELEAEKATVAQKHAGVEQRLGKEQTLLAAGERALKRAKEALGAVDSYRAREQEVERLKARRLDVEADTERQRLEVLKVRQQLAEDEKYAAAQEADLRAQLQAQNERLAELTSLVEARKAAAAQREQLRAEAQHLELRIEGLHQDMAAARAKHKASMEEGKKLFIAHLDAEDDKIRRRLQE